MQLSGGTTIARSSLQRETGMQASPFSQSEDRFGIKPLHYATYEGRLYIASEIKAILAAGVPAIWDKEVLSQTGLTLQR